MLKTTAPYSEALLNSYAVIFFSNNKLFALLLLLVSFFNPIAGLAGLVAVVLAIAIATFTGLSSYYIQKGFYSYNALFIGIGMGTFYNVGIAFIVLFVVAVLFSVVLSAVFQNRMAKLGLPFLSLPFILCFWLILLVTKEFSAIDLSTRNIYWLNEMYAVGDARLVRFVMFMENLNLPALVNVFLRALSSLFFQNNILAGLLICIGILLNSRILFSLLIVGFLSAYGFNYIVKAYDGGINYYLLGANFMMVSAALGSFFVIPSVYSYVWAILSVPITFVMVIALSKIMGLWLLPVFSLPFCITVLSLLYFFMVKQQKERLVLTPVQLYSPEKNLYNFLNNKEREIYKQFIRLQLPFMGEWMVSQGYDGNITHKGDWSKALDFIIVDHKLKTYKDKADKPEDFYCYNKPVLAAANGFVQEIVDYIDDNEIGKINQQLNWGNSIVLKHAEGLYTKMSHLRKHSFKVKTGDYVRQGEVVATCGNSGRSPEPHLHFQVQLTPYIGSKTFAYPMSSYSVLKNDETSIKEFCVPIETELVKNIVSNITLKQTFDFLPGYRLTVKAEGFEDEKWEVFTDAYNQSYIYCHNKQATAYFGKNETYFYFTSYYGSHDTLLYHFYVAAYKIIFSVEEHVVVTDKFPLQLSKNNLLKWIQDIVSPFYIFSRLLYQSSNKILANDIFDQSVEIESSLTLQFMTSKKIISAAQIVVKNNRLSSFSIQKEKKHIKATCIPKEL